MRINNANTEYTQQGKLGQVQICSTKRYREEVGERKDTH